MVESHGSPTVTHTPTFSKGARRKPVRETSSGQLQNLRGALRSPSGLTKTTFLMSIFQILRKNVISDLA